MNKFGFLVAAIALMPFWALANTNSFKNHVLYAQDSGSGDTPIVSQQFDQNFAQYGRNRMTSTFIQSLASAAIAVSSVAYAASPSGKNHVLYNQSGGADEIGIVSQAFDANHVQYDSLGADDFVIPAKETWVIKQVAALGRYYYGPGPAMSENVVFYADDRGAPGAAVPGGTFADVVGADFEGSFNIYLPGKGLKLHRGKYWVSVQANMPYSLGWWGWYTEQFQGKTGSPAMWENPANGYATGCTTFTVETQCWQQGQGQGKAFVIYGEEK